MHEHIQILYEKMAELLPSLRSALGRKLTLTEKILYSHLFGQLPDREYIRGKDYVDFLPDRVIMQDATAQMAILQFMNAGMKKVAVPSSVHCDHLIVAHGGAEEDLKHADDANKEVYDFLSSASNKYGIEFWKPGSGIIHQVALENYAFPGGLIIGSDSHTPNAGGLGMLAIGVGGSDVMDVMAGFPWELEFPKVIGVKLTGSLQGFASPKDVILKLVGMLTVNGGKGYVLEYFGEGTHTISATGKATICNMGAELGATCSVFPYDAKMRNYLHSTNRAGVAQLADEYNEHLRADAGVTEEPERYYDQIVEINLDELLPFVNGPFTPDRATPINLFADTVRKEGWPNQISVALIGSCTNSSYEDLSTAAFIAKSLMEQGIKSKVELIITPGSTLVYEAIERDGILQTLVDFGGIVMANACGPCIGQWERHMESPDMPNTILSSFNRNFKKRNDGHASTHAFVASPATVIILAAAGNLSFNPLTDTLLNEEGQKVPVPVPTGYELPPNGYGNAQFIGRVMPVANGSEVEVIIADESNRLQRLNPFDPWNGENFMGMPILIKTKGKCTTDHISQAGSWLKYRGHLDKISNNMLIGATNAFSDQINLVTNQLTGEQDTVPNVQRYYRSEGVPSIVIGEDGYGEGSSREHAAMEPRHLGVKVILVKSFARIHETNLKKQGMLAVTFADPLDYDKIREDDRIDITGLDTFEPGKQLIMMIWHKDGTHEGIFLNHTYNQQQIEWFKAGSSLNVRMEMA